MKPNNIFDYVKDNITVLEVAQKFPDFYKTLQKSGNDYGTECPAGHPSSSGRSFKLVYDEGAEKNFYICHNCGISGGPFNLAQILNNWSTKDTIGWFIKEWNLDDSYRHYVKHQKTPKELIEEENATIRTFLFEKLLEEGKRLLFETAGRDALDYLVGKRKYNPDLIKLTDFMYLPKQSTAKQILYKAYPGLKPHIDNLKLVSDFGDDFRLGVPYRTNYGIITGLVLRATEPKGVSGITFSGKAFTNQRWTSTPGMQKDILFGLDKIKQGTQTLLIVEGYPDTVYLPALGYKNVVGLGTARFGKKQLESLIAKGIKNVILSLDNDKVGPANTADMIKLLMQHDIRVYVLEPKNLAPYKDADEFVVANGLESFVNVVNAAEGGELWALEYFYKLHPDTPKGKTDAFEACIDFGTFINSLNIEQTFVNKLSQKSELPKRQLSSHLAKLRRANIQTNDAAADIKLSKEEYKEKLALSADEVRARTLTELFAGEIMPFQERDNMDYYIYDKKNDKMTEINSRDKLENTCKDGGILLPEVIPCIKMVFNPQSFDKLSIEERTINLFTPTPYMYWEKNDEVVDLEVECPTIMRVLRNIIKDPENKRYMDRWFNWLAYILQKRTKSNVAWVFMGAQGIGKNLMYEEIIKPFFGHRLCGMMDNREAHSDYNTTLRNKIFMVFNEISHNRSERDSLAAQLKVYITEPTIRTREIYGKYVETDNHLNAVFFSNNTDMPVVIEKDDRRYCVFSSDTPLSSFPDWNYEEWSTLIAHERDHFYRFLINYDMNLHLATTVFMTPAKQDLIDGSATRFEQFGEALIKLDASWINEQLDSAYALKNDPFATKYRVTQEELDLRKMPVDRARALFQVIFPDTKMTANAFTRQLKIAGIDKKPVRIGGEVVHGFVWDKGRNGSASTLLP